jgi:hypothetical protein
MHRRALGYFLVSSLVPEPGDAHVLGMKLRQAPPEISVETESFMTEHERGMMWTAAVTMADSRGLLMRVTAMFGQRIEALRARLMKAGDRFGGEAFSAVTQKIQDGVEDVLWNSYEFAAAGLDVVPRIARPKRAGGNRAHKMAAAASGVASGFVGLPGVLFDVPFTTMTILRSIAEVARDMGEDLRDEETKRACLEVLAFGGPSSVDDSTETGYWATRMGMSHATVNVLIRSAAGRFGLVLSEKFLAQAVPVAGAVSGGALNWAFTDYYQKMARVHFTLRALEKRTGQPEKVRAAFGEMVGTARDRRRISKRAGPAKAVGYLPRDVG